MLRLLVVLATLVALVFGHGRVLDPPGRASAWRAGFGTEPNYDDDGLNCGGFSHQWSVNNGLCGICGDPWDAPEPRPHELGGKWGTGIITRDYSMGSIINVLIELSVYHKGYWMLKICPDPLRNDQECFDQYVLELEDGETQFYPDRGSGKYELAYRLPAGLACDHCVLQWRYIAGNNWGDCKNGTQGLGCGNQENFGACSDIKIESVDLTIPVVNAPEELTPLSYFAAEGSMNTWKGQRHPNQIESGGKTDSRKKKHKSKLRYQNKKKQKHVKKIRPNQITYWRANTIGPNSRLEIYKHNLDTKLPMPLYYF